MAELPDVVSAIHTDLASGDDTACKGTLDILLEHEDGTKCVVECKSARGNAFSL
jgi:hypothetical protein